MTLQHKPLSYMMRVAVIIILSACVLIPTLLSASFQEGYDLYKKGKFYESEAVLLREKELTPSNLDVYAVLGWCYLNTGRYKNAIDISNEGLERNAEDTRFLTTLGRSYFELKRYNDSLGYLERAIALNPENSFNYYYVGRLYLEQGKYALAETALSASIKLKRDRYVFYLFRGEVYERMEDYASAEDDYKQALALKPNDPRLKEALIRVVSKQTEEASLIQ